MQAYDGMTFHGDFTPMLAKQIARQLHVDAVVEGTVTRSGNQVRITAQLIEAPSDRHLWAETYEREADRKLILYTAERMAKR